MESNDPLSDSSDSSGSHPSFPICDPRELSLDVKKSLVQIVTMMEKLPHNKESYNLLKSINLTAKQFTPTREELIETNWSDVNAQLPQAVELEPQTSNRNSKPAMENEVIWKKKNRGSQELTSKE